MPSDKHNHRVLPTLRRWANWSLLALAGVFTALAMWIRVRFGAVTFDQIVTNLPIGAGKGIGNNSLAGEVAVWCIAVPVGVVALLALGARRFRRAGARRPVKLIPAVSLVAGFSVFLTVAGVPEFAIARLSETSIASAYVQPAVTSVPATPRNLITIYLESGENTYGDEAVMGENLLANLDAATGDGWQDFRGLDQYEGGGWTMAGLVGTQCGMPLKSLIATEGLDFNKMGEEVAHYLPGATCLGDVLSDRGYRSVFVGGADDDFAGKKTFLTDHGYGKVVGLSDWKGVDSRDYISQEWGLADSHTLKHAADVLDELHAADRPFNLTVLTLDTHEPPGIFPDCDDADAVRMATAIKCSMKAVATFLRHAERAGYLDDTAVVVMGDHLKGTGDQDTFREVLRGQEDRTIIFRLWSPDGKQITRDQVDQLSVLPTTLELLGFGLDGGRAGLGVSFVGDHDLTGTALALGDGDYRALLKAPSTELYQQFWGTQR
jgi:phosphoglycerol transferase